MRACDAPTVVTSGETITSTVGFCEMKYFSPECTIPAGATLLLTIKELSGHVNVYASRTSNLPGPYDYEFKNESVGTKTLSIPYLAGTGGRVVVGIKGVEPGVVSAFTLDAWIDVFEEAQSAFIQVSENVAPGTFVWQPAVFLQASLVYSFESGNTNDAFIINPSTGAVTVGPAGLDYEATPSYALVISGVDPTNVCISGFLDLGILAVRDINDNPPIFTPHAR
jgi:hypothetical protein